MDAAVRQFSPAAVFSDTGTDENDARAADTVIVFSVRAPMMR